MKENNCWQDTLDIMTEIKLESYVNGAQASTLYGFAWYKAHWTKSTNYLDVGTNMGNSAIILSSALKHQALPTTKKVWTIDNYDYYPNYAMSYGNLTKDQVIEQARKNMSQFGIDDILSINVGNDIDFIGSLPDNSLDLIFDDSAHTYEATYARLESYIPKLNTNSLIVIHDYYINYFPIIKAVADFKQKFGDMLVEYGTIEGIHAICCKVDTESMGGA